MVALHSVHAVADARPAGARRSHQHRRIEAMLLLAVFIVFAFVGQAINIWICIVIDKVAPNFSFMVFFVLYMAVFWLAWRLAIHVTEKEFVDSLRKRIATHRAS
jgi:hypothetical protein